MDHISEQILRRRMHGLYLSRKCNDLIRLSRELLGLHCWFHRNVVFSGCIRGADLTDWKNELTKTWLYRGTLHGVVYEELPLLLALHSGEFSFEWLLGKEQAAVLVDRIISLMEDGVYSRAEMRQIFACEYEDRIINDIFSSWGGIFVYLARLGKVAFRDMTSRDFDLIDAEPALTADEALPELLERYFSAYGPATLADAAWFFGLPKDGKIKLSELDLDGFDRFTYNRDIYYYVDDKSDMGEIPELTLLSGFDPLIVSYTDRSAVLPPEYRKDVITKSGICLPTIAVNGKVAGLWNIKKGKPELSFFEEQPRRIQDTAFDLVDEMRQKTVGIL